MRMQRNKTLPLMILLLLSSCAVGPDYQRPDALKDAGMEEDSFQVSLTLAESLPEPVAVGASQKFVRNRIQANWWESFDSDKLNTMVEKALLNSPTLAAADASLVQAQQTYAAQSGSSLYPQVSLGTGGSRQRINKAAFGLPSSSSTYTLYNAGLNLGYNFDLFGTNKRLLESLEAEASYKAYQYSKSRIEVLF